MTWAACAARVEKKLGGLDDVTAAVNLATARGLVPLPNPGVTRGDVFGEEVTSCRG
jgi:hypothetical protein